jgi:hypothetical protein
METKHTPGPWHADWDDNGQWYIEPLGVTGTKLRGDSGDCVEAANARLIAAAPELLKALEHMRDMTQSGWITPEDKPTDWQLGWEAACEQFKIAKVNELAEAAIRKGRP